MVATVLMGAVLYLLIKGALFARIAELVPSVLPSTTLAAWTSMFTGGATRPPRRRRFLLGRSGLGSPMAQDSRIPISVARQGTSTDALHAQVHAAIGERPTQLDITRLMTALLRDPN